MTSLEFRLYSVSMVYLSLVLHPLDKGQQALSFFIETVARPHACDKMRVRAGA